MKVARFVLSLVVCVAGIMLLASAVLAQSIQDVTTWHYDNYRTGWQQGETTLTTSALNNCNGQVCFGKVFQYNVHGAVYAQPLAVNQVTSHKCPSPPAPCNVVFIATEQDILYAFDADYMGTTTPGSLWSLDLAAAASETFLDCSNFVSDPPPPPCAKGVIYPDLGVTGTPVIDEANTILYVVSLVWDAPLGKAEYFIHAVDYTTGLELANSPQQITASVTGVAPTSQCGTASGTGTLTFDSTEHFQRAGLLLLNGEMYVAFTPADSEIENGWIMAYHYDKSASALDHDDTFVTTPFGTGGGIWMSAAGLASDGAYIYISTANGTFDIQNGGTDYGDSVIKLTPYVQGSTRLAEVDYFTPADVLNFPPPGGQGLCKNDEDFGSGGVMLFPDEILTAHPDLMIAADKQSRFYVVDRNHLSGYNSTGDQIVQELVTPQGTNGQPEETNQGYWGAPAYWKWTTSSTTARAIYYSVDATVDEPREHTNFPLPMNMYLLDPGSTPGPLVPYPPSYASETAFCGHGAAPSVSSAIQTNSPYTGVAGTGIVWAYEDANADNAPGQQSPDCKGGQLPVVLHAYDASNLGNGTAELYNSSGLTSVHYATKFSTPMVFNGRVYIGTQLGSSNGQLGNQNTEVDVFGLCNQDGNPVCFTN
jgi:hypothetical protein